MPQPPLENVVAHWSKLIEGFHTSTLEFYKAVEEALARRKLPHLVTTRIDWNERGIVSPGREYLRVSGEHYVFDLCAAPFGSGFFFSSWVTKRKARFVLLYLAVFALLSLLIAWLLQKTLTSLSSGAHGLEVQFVLGILLMAARFFLLPLAFLIVLWLTAALARAGHFGAEDAILVVPVIGWFYERVFAPPTYYRVDTMLMFQSAVHAAMLEVIDGLTTQKGVRGLTDDERKPIFHKLI